MPSLFLFIKQLYVMSNLFRHLIRRVGVYNSQSIIECATLQVGCRNKFGMTGFLNMPIYPLPFYQ